MHIEFEKINKGFVKLELPEVCVKRFKITIQNYLMIGYKLFFFRFILLLIKMGLNRLMGHPKVQLNDNCNLRRNSLQLGENDANEFTSRLNRVKCPYLVILTSDRNNNSGVGKLIQMDTKSNFMNIFLFQCFLDQNQLSREIQK